MLIRNSKTTNNATKYFKYIEIKTFQEALVFRMLQKVAFISYIQCYYKVYIYWKMRVKNKFSNTIVVELYKNS